MNRVKSFSITAHAACLSALALVACNGDEPLQPEPTMLVGVAAVGSPLAGASVSISDADAATTDVTATASASGAYSADVSALKAPLLVKASGSVEGAPATYWAVVPAVGSGASNTANVTPLTTAVAALVAPAGDPQALADVAALAANATAAKVADATALLVNTLNTDPQTAAALGSAFNPLSTPFAANGSGIDGVLDRVAVDLSAGGVTLTNQAAAVTAAGVPAAVMLTPAMAAGPASAPTLPETAAAGDVPTAAELAALAAKLEACLALPPQSRVTLDGEGTVTSVSAACNVAPANWRSSGRSWAEEVGQYTLTKNQLTGAKLEPGRIVLALAPEDHTEPKVFKHPYCNAGPCVVARWPMRTASNRIAASEWVLGKVAGQWDFVGNQRPYRSFVEPRLVRKINANRNGAAAGNTGDPYFFKDRFESQLRLTFDLANTSADTSDVRAVRFRGPGLPAAGVVLVRSQRCGSDDRLGITNQIGTSFVAGTSNLQFWTGGASTDFMLDAANLDGTPLAMPVPVNNGTTASFQDFAPAPVANQASTVPAWSRYKIEVFRFSTLSDTPDEIIYTRIGTPAENAAAGAAKPWPSLDAAFVSSYLTPTGTNAGSFTDMARTMSWTSPVDTYVASSYLFSQNFATVTNAQNESAFYGVRSRLDFEPAALGDTVGHGWRFGSPASGTSLSSFTANSGSNPNPRCAGAGGVVGLTDNFNDYREAGLSFRGSDRKLYVATWFWDN